MSTPAIEVFLFKDSYEPFITLLREGGIEFTTHMPPARVTRNSGVTIEILKIVVPALTAVIVTYLKARQSRKVIITTEDNTVIHAEGLSQSDLEGVIASARNMSVIETHRKET